MELVFKARFESLERKIDKQHGELLAAMLTLKDAMETSSIVNSARHDKTEARFDALETRFDRRFDRLETRIERLEDVIRPRGPAAAD